jgi:hypothetical protein
VTLRSRLQKLERTLPGPDPLADDPAYQLWRLFYEGALEVLEPFPEARKRVERNRSIQEPCLFRPDWQRTASGDDARFSFCKESLWAALETFPEALQALDQALQEAFGEEAAEAGEMPGNDTQRKETGMRAALQAADGDGPGRPDRARGNAGAVPFAPPGSIPHPRG